MGKDSVTSVTGTLAVSLWTAVTLTVALPQHTHTAPRRIKGLSTASLSKESQARSTGGEVGKTEGRNSLLFWLGNSLTQREAGVSHTPVVQGVLARSSLVTSLCRFNVGDGA